MLPVTVSPRLISGANTLPLPSSRGSNRPVAHRQSSLASPLVYGDMARPLSARRIHRIAASVLPSSLAQTAHVTKDRLPRSSPEIDEGIFDQVTSSAPACVRESRLPDFPTRFASLVNSAHLSAIVGVNEPSVDRLRHGNQFIRALEPQDAQLDFGVVSGSLDGSVFQQRRGSVSRIQADARCCSRRLTPEESRKLSVIICVALVFFTTGCVVGFFSFYGLTRSGTHSHDPVFSPLPA